MDPNLENQNPDNSIDENALLEGTPIFDPNVETQEEITASIVGTKETPGQSTPAATTTSGTPAADDFDSFIETSIKEVNPDFQLPIELREGKKADGTPLTKAEMHKLRLNLILENTQLDLEEDEFVRQYAQAKANGINANQFVTDYSRRVNVLNMPSKDFIESYYRGMMKGDGQRQYDDAAIQKFIESKSDIELDQIANQMKGEYAKQMAGKITQEQGRQIEQINQKNAKIVEAYTEKLKTENSIFGIDLPEAEKTEVITAVQKMFVKDKTGTSEFDRIMQNDQIVLQIAPILHLLNTGKLQGLVSTMKETIKAKETDKLDPKPNIVGGSVQGPEGIDEKALVD